MKIIEAKKKHVDSKLFMKRTANMHDAQQYIDFDCLINLDGEPVFLYKRIDHNLDDLLWAVQNIEYLTGKRTLGLMSTSAVFGFSPKLTVRRDFCSSTSMSHRFPQQHNILCNWASTLTEYYKEYFPKVYQYHTEEVLKRVKPEWVLKNSLFTSGIVNKNNQLKYHMDAGNFKNTMSNMVVFKSGVEGGYLTVPELDIVVSCADRTLVIFDGSKIFHGVTTIHQQAEDSYRYSIVYYTLEQMWKCMTAREELDRIRKVKQGREKKRLK